MLSQDCSEDGRSRQDGQMIYHIGFSQQLFRARYIMIEKQKVGRFKRRGNENCTSCFVLSRDIQNAVCIDVKADCDLGNTTRGGSNATELKFAQEIVVSCSCTLSLVHLDENAWLVVRIGWEHLLLLSRNGCVPRDDHCLHQNDDVWALGPVCCIPTSFQQL